MWRAASLAAVQLLTLALPCQSSIAEAWGAPPHQAEATEPEVHHAPAEAREETAGTEEVLMTAGGAMQRKGSVMRRDAASLAEETHHHHNHHAAHAKAVFTAMDLNGDGLVSGNEIKALSKNKDYHIPETLLQMQQHIDDGEAGIDFRQFQWAVHQAAEQHKLHHTSEEHSTAAHHAQIHEHDHLAHMPKEDELLERSSHKLTTKTTENTQATWVTCGGHKAPSCEVCPQTDASGQTVFDHGMEWCHGDCVYHEDKCHDKGSIVVTGTVKGESKGYATTPAPDILNPNITVKDSEIINDAAEASIREENLESAEKQKAEEEAAEGNKFSWGKFWLIVIVTFSVILGVCACASIIALVVFGAFGNPGPPPKGEEGEDEGEGLADNADPGKEKGEDAAAAEPAAEES